MTVTYGSVAWYSLYVMAVSTLFLLVIASRHMYDSHISQGVSIAGGVSVLMVVFSGCVSVYPRSDYEPVATRPKSHLRILASLPFLLLLLTFPLSEECYFCVLFIAAGAATVVTSVSMACYRYCGGGTHIVTVDGSLYVASP